MIRRLAFALWAACLLMGAAQVLAADPCTDFLRQAMQKEGLGPTEIQNICETAAELENNRRPKITAEKVAKDIVGKMVGNWIFQADEWRDIDILESKYDQDSAKLTVNIDTIRSKTGTLRIRYRWTGTQWKLIRIFNVDFE